MSFAQSLPGLFHGANRSLLWILKSPVGVGNAGRPGAHMYVLTSFDPLYRRILHCESDTMMAVLKLFSCTLALSDFTGSSTARFAEDSAASAVSACEICSTAAAWSTRAPGTDFLILNL